MMNFDLLQAIIFDGCFAAVASVGFAVISNPQRNSLWVSALLAAIGHDGSIL